jgi:Short C-terminal domain
VLGTILLLVSALAIWVDRLALQTDTWVETSDELLQDDEIRAVLAARLTDELYSSVDVAAQLEAVLPPAAKPLAGPAAAGLREFTERRANILLQRPFVVTAWRAANRTAHAQFVRIVEGEAAAIETQGGDVVLLLQPLLADLAEQVGLGNVAARLPADAGAVVIMDADQLEALQMTMSILDLVATWLWAIALACWALALYLSPGRRLKTMRGIGFGLVFVGLLILLILRLAGDFVVNSLVKVESNQAAAESVLDIVTALLRTSALALFALGVLVIVGTWLAGPGRRATAFRRWSAPLLRDHPEAVWGVFAFLVLLVLIWGPIPATRNLVGIVVLVGLASLGLWAFRRATLMEFPDEPWRGWRLPRRSRASSEDDRFAQLERLNALHQQGALTQQEFEAEKAALLGS